LDFLGFGTFFEYMRPSLGPFGAALVMALLLTPLFRWLAPYVGFVDKPNARKVHSTPTALLGGLAIFLAFMTAVVHYVSFTDKALWGIVAGAAILALVGLWDDRKGLSPLARLLVQVAVASSVVIFFDLSAVFLKTPWLNIPFTIFWIVGITNAFNLLDNMDGLSAGLAFIAAAAFAILALRKPPVSELSLRVGMVSAAMAGASLGFLPYNLRSARIFMGDAGSLVLGFVMATVAIWGSWRSPSAATSVAIPLLVLAYPIFDTTLVVLFRWKRGQPIHQGGKDHSSHRLVNLGLSKNEAVFVIHLLALCFAINAMLISGGTFRGAIMAMIMGAILFLVFGIIMSKAKIE
jgi:UDP-GlcNAc:undecaprenyl-phosphate GlcNAc-1-phosphate transferase